MHQLLLLLFFFFAKPAAEGDLREACTVDIDSRVRSVVHELGDFGLISKLSTGDMTALELNVTRIA